MIPDPDRMNALSADAEENIPTDSTAPVFNSSSFFLESPRTATASPDDASLGPADLESNGGHPTQAKQKKRPLSASFGESVESKRSRTVSPVDHSTTPVGTQHAPLVELQLTSEKASRRKSSSRGINRPRNDNDDYARSASVNPKCGASVPTKSEIYAPEYDETDEEDEELQQETTSDDDDTDMALDEEDPPRTIVTEHPPDVAAVLPGVTPRSSHKNDTKGMTTLHYAQIACPGNNVHPDGPVRVQVWDQFCLANVFCEMCEKIVGVKQWNGERWSWVKEVQKDYLQAVRDRFPDAVELCPSSKNFWRIMEQHCDAEKQSRSSPRLQQGCPFNAPSSGTGRNPESAPPGSTDHFALIKIDPSNPLFVSLTCVKGCGKKDKARVEVLPVMGLLRPTGSNEIDLERWAPAISGPVPHASDVLDAAPSPVTLRSADDVGQYCNEKQIKLEVHGDEEQFVAPWSIKPGTVMIRASMGMGKTRQMVNALETYLKAKPDARVLFITPRITLATDLCSVLASMGFALYMNVGNRSQLGEQNRLIVQLESLHYLMPTGLPNEHEKFLYDVVVLDESEELLMQFSSKTVDSKRRNTANGFTFLVQNAKTLVLMDADLGPRSLDFVTATRSSSSQVIDSNRHNTPTNPAPQSSCTAARTNPTPHSSSQTINSNRHNTVDAFTCLMPNAKDANMGPRSQGFDANPAPVFYLYTRRPYMESSRRAIEHTKYDDWLMTLVLSIRKGLRVDVVMNLNKGDQGAKTLLSTLRRLFPPEKRILLLNGEASDHDKREPCCEFWVKYDIVIRTPVVGPGVNFDRDHFDVQFALFTDGSNTPRQAIQQLGRVRKFVSKDIHIHIVTNCRIGRAKEKELPERFDEVQKYRCPSTVGVLKYHHQAFEQLVPALRPQLNDEGAIELTPPKLEPLATAVVYNMAETYAAKNRFRPLFLTQLAHAGVTVVSGSSGVVSESVKAAWALYVRSGELQHYMADASRLAATHTSEDPEGVNSRIDRGTASEYDRQQMTVAMLRYRFHLDTEPTAEFIKHWGGDRKYELLDHFLAMIQTPEQLTRRREQAHESVDGRQHLHETVTSIKQLLSLLGFDDILDARKQGPFDPKDTVSEESGALAHRLKVILKLSNKGGELGEAWTHCQLWKLLKSALKNFLGFELRADRLRAGADRNKYMLSLDPADDRKMYAEMLYVRQGRNNYNMPDMPQVLDMLGNPPFRWSALTNVVPPYEVQREAPIVAAPQQRQREAAVERAGKGLIKTQRTDDRRD